MTVQRLMSVPTATRDASAFFWISTKEAQYLKIKRILAKADEQSSLGKNIA
jgi:hypothetical protein